MWQVDFKELILLYITISGILSYAPQIIKVIKTKSSEDISVGTWVIWVMNSSLYLTYLLLSGVSVWLILSQICEVTLISITLLVVIIYRKR